MPVTTASPALVPFTAGFEDTVHRAYRDAGGVVTIGTGFTNLSRCFVDYWVETRGRRLRLGDTITDAECRMLLGRLIAEEYAPPVAVRFRGATITQHAFDAATDMAFNCGAGALKWRWATSLAGGAVADAAVRMRVTAVTAGGKRLAGLVRRRAAEARLMEAGDYGGGGAPALATLLGEVKAYQRQLAALGLYAGAIDGLGGPGTLTDRALRQFQRDSGLVVDGIVGPATRATLRRAVEAQQAGRVTGVGAAAGGVSGAGADLSSAADGLNWHLLATVAGWALLAAAIVGAGFLLWRWRGVILRRRTAA